MALGGVRLKIKSLPLVPYCCIILGESSREGKGGGGERVRERNKEKGTRRDEKGIKKEERKHGRGRGGRRERSR